MYNRAERKGLQVSSQTDPHVCPNTYVTDNHESNCKAYGLAPFITSASRFPCTLRPQGPSPASYYPQLLDKTPGCASLRNRAPRFHKEQDKPTETQDPTRSISEAFQVNKGHIQRRKVPFFFDRGYPPSIPTTNTCGYASQQNGIFKAVMCSKEEEEAEEVTRGCLQEEPYWKGCRWSAYTSQRDSLTPADTPAPNAYNIRGPNSWNQPDRYRFARRSYVPRYLEHLENQLCKNTSPSPADYSLDVKVVTPRKRTTPGRTRPKPPFLTSAHRFTHNLNDNPGPGTYDPTTAANIQINPSNRCFLTTARRFAHSKSVQTPGPNQYVLKTFTDDLLTSKLGQKAAFNSSAGRNTGHVSADAHLLPGPNTYNTRAQPATTKLGPTASFKKTSQTWTPKVIQENVGPASYNVTPAFNYLTTCTRHRNSTTGFGATAKRFPGQGDDAMIPGPKYNLQHYKPGRDVKVGRLGQAVRFRCSKACGPGPADYTLQTSTVKPTHNITLDNTLPPLHTTPSWRTRLCQAKTLRNHAERNRDIEKEQREYEKQVLKVVDQLNETFCLEPDPPQQQLTQQLLTLKNMFQQTPVNQQNQAGTNYQWKHYTLPQRHH